MVSKKKVMVVDDQENILMLLRELLQSEGYDVETAGSGMECLNKLDGFSPDLILLDVMMSNITGLDVAEAIRLDPRTKDTKIIFLTVVKSTEIKPSLLKKLKVTDYIGKPFDNGDLIKRVKRALMKQAS